MIILRTFYTLLQSHANFFYLLVIQYNYWMGVINVNFHPFHLNSIVSIIKRKKNLKTKQGTLRDYKWYEILSRSYPVPVFLACRSPSKYISLALECLYYRVFANLLFYRKIENVDWNRSFPYLFSHMVSHNSLATHMSFSSRIRQGIYT